MSKIIGITKKVIHASFNFMTYELTIWTEKFHAERLKLHEEKYERLGAITAELVIFILCFLLVISAQKSSIIIKILNFWQK